MGASNTMEGSACMVLRRKNNCLKQCLLVDRCVGAGAGFAAGAIGADFLRADGDR